MSAQQFVHIAGWSQCGFYRKASGVLTTLSILFPNNIKLSVHEFPTRDEYRKWLIDSDFRSKFKEVTAHKHTSSPFAWIGHSEEIEDISRFIGGCDDSIDWSKTFCTPATRNTAANGVHQEDSMVDDGYKPGHGFDYDLIVIGGGSGGLAASKEAASYGAKVAVLDFVTPSPQGTKWGLGGTCVNVGCIPKKLMHYGAIVNEAIQADSKHFGISAGEENKFDWPTLRENVQNHIKGLNFKYRVNLRENSVTYLNRLGKFIDKNTLELKDRKGNISQVTAARFIVAVGGRPTPLDCPGGELAVSSDDIFALEKSPGKVLCVGASYISLECAGFLKGLGHDTTVAVRSILLRGFDRECAEKIGEYMDDHGVKFKYKIVPTKLEKTGDKIKVDFSDGSTDTYDTVLVAVGRTGLTANLSLENVGISTVKAGKIPCKLEQTCTPNIYAIGDVMEGCPELTPVAIKAGQLLSRRLFNAATKPMDYKNVCTTVFTPIEYSTVGYSEEDAIESFGADNISVYHKSFIPLEWAIVDARSHHQAFAKVITLKNEGDKIIGIHYLGPNAGEVMQGYGVAMKTGTLTYQTLMDTVGIHPTTSEEIVTLTVTKESGADAKAGGC